MADEYIKKEDAIRSIADHDEFKGERWIKEAWADYLIEDAKPADVAPVRHGRNVYMDVKGYCEFKCSLCGADALIVEGGELDGGLFNYCPNCGAKMDEEVEA